MPHTMEEEIELMLAGVEGDGAQKRIRSLVRHKHALMEEQRKQAEAHAAALAAAEKRVTDLEATHAAALTQARASWQAEAAQDLALADLGVVTPFDRDTLRRAHATAHPDAAKAPALDAWAKATRDDPEALKAQPASVQAILAGKPGGNGKPLPPDPDRGTRKAAGAGLTADKVRDMSPEEFDRLTGRA